MAKEEVQIKPMEEAKPSEMANPEKDGKQRELPEMVHQETGNATTTRKKAVKASGGRTKT